MNLLAHAYLSFNEPDILVGNMISDHVKGRKKFDFPDNIQRGIALHREIDAYTDTHHSTHEIKSFFRSSYGLYAAPFSDIVYDYFLANDVNEFANEASLKAFTGDIYAELEKHRQWFPERFNYMFTYMQQQNWLYNYRFHHGIAKSFEGLVRRATYMNSSDEAMKIFVGNEAAMRNSYEAFFPALKKHASEFLALLKK